MDMGWSLHRSWQIFCGWSTQTLMSFCYGGWELGFPFLFERAEGREQGGLGAGLTLAKNG